MANMQKEQRYGVIIKARAKSFPDRHELEVGFLLAKYFQSQIICIDVKNHKTPDFLVERLNQVWELKSIRGNTDNTIQHNFSKAKKQSQNIIINLKRTKMSPKSAIGRIKRELSKPTSIKRVIVITKQNKIVAIKK